MEETKPIETNKMKDPKSVLVLRNGTAGTFEFNYTIETYDRINGVDYSIFEVTAPVIRAVFEDRPQLLITGNVVENGQKLSRFIKDAREKNPQLIIVYFSNEGGGEGCDFDLIIPTRLPQPIRWNMLDLIIKDFEGGEIQRKVPDPVSVQA